MTMAAMVARWIAEAEARDAVSLHLAPGVLPRIRVGKELLPMETFPVGAGGAAGPVIEAPSSDDVERFVRSVVPPGVFDTVLSRGEGEFELETPDGRRHGVRLFRSMEQWRATVMLVRSVPEEACARPGLSPHSTEPEGPRS